MSFTFNRTNNKIIKKTVSLATNPTINTNVFEETYQIISATNSTITLPNTSNANSNYYNNWYIRILSGLGINQIRQIQSYNSSIKQITLKTNLDIIPSSSDSIILYNKLNSNIIWQESNNRFAPVYMKNSTNLNQMGETIEYLDFGCNNLTILSNKQSHSTTSGSLIVNGGSGITGSVNIGNSLNVTNNINCNSLSVNGVSITGNLSNIYLTDIVPGTASASKSLVLNSSKDISGINSLTATTLISTNLTLNGTTITASASDINKLTGTTVVTSDFNKLASITASATELNYNDITTIGTAEANKAVILDSSRNIININNMSLNGSGDVITLTNSGSGNRTNLRFINDARSWELGSRGSTASNSNSFYLYDNTANAHRLIINSSGSINIVNHNNSTIGLQLGGILITASATEINKLTGTTALTSDFNKLASITASATELNYLDFTTGSAGIAEASKALVLNSSLDISGINSLTATSLISTNLKISTNTIIDSSRNILNINTFSSTGLISNVIANNTVNNINYQSWTNDLATDIVTALQMNNIGMDFGTTSNHPIALMTNNIERLTITNSGIINITNTTNSTTVNSGALIISGGIGIAGNIYSSGTIVTSVLGQGFSHNDGTINLVSWVNNSTIANNAYFGTSTNHNLYLQTNNTGRIFISNTGNVAIGSTNNTYKLDVTGDINIIGSLRFSGIAITATAAEINYLDITTEGVGQASKALILDNSNNLNSGINNFSISGILTVGSVGSSNRINFKGTTGDSSDNFTVISERIYNSTEQSELLLFKGNDPSGSSGPDRIRMRASEFRFQTYTTAENYSGLLDNNNRLFIANDGKVGINTTNPNYQLDISGDINLTGSLIFSGTIITATAADINKLAAVTASATEINYLDITTEGVAQPNKALILDSNRDINNIRNLTISSLTSGGNIISSNANASFRILPHSDNIIYLQAGLNTTAGSSADIFIGNYGQDTAGSSRKIIIKSNGRLGLGTSNPQSLLDFGQTATDSTINLYTHSTTNETFKIGANSSLIKYQSGTSAGHAWYTGSTTTSSGSESMRLNNLNALSINTSNANAILNVLGSSNYLDGSYNRIIRCSGANASPVNIEIQCHSGASTTSTNSGWIGTVSNNNMRFGANASTHLTITPSGNIGINNTSPNYKLDINGSYWATGGEIHTGTDWQNNGLHHSAYGDDNVLYRLISKGYVSYPSGPFQHQFGATGNTSLEFLTNNSTRLMIAANGNIGIRTTSPSYPLHVSGGASYTGTFIFYARSGSNSNIGTATNNSDTSIYASGRVTAGEFNAFSDSRIKKNITNINDISALNTLRLIEPKQYNYIDTLNKTNQPVWGFLAQQVSEVLDYSVSLITDYIPNIFQLANKSLLENGDNILSFTNSINYDLNGTGKVKLIDTNDKTIYVTIKNKINNTSFSVNELLENEEYFIYGEEVSNYHSLNKDSIFTITTAAVQEIDRIVIEQKNKIENLENENQLLKDQIQNILERLQLFSFLIFKLT